MSTVVTDKYSDLIDGPFYEHSPAATAALLPHIPRPDELHREFCAGLSSLDLGRVDVVKMTVVSRNVALFCSDGQREVFQRASLYGRATIPNELVEGLGLGGASGHESAALIRETVMGVVRQFAGRLAEQVTAFRTGRPAGGAVVIRHVGEHMPRLLTQGGSVDKPRICLDEYTDQIVAIFGAYYAITPPGVEVKDQP